MRREISVWLLAISVMLVGMGRTSWGQSGNISTVAQLGTVPELGYVTSLAVDNADNVYAVGEYSHLVWKVTSSGVVSVFAGTGQQGYSGDGGPAISAKLNRPIGIDVDDAGNVYIADTYNHVVRKVDPSGTITTVVGTGAGGPTGRD